ncbi:MAG: hypothetical protein HZB76_03560 [Chlamydiae bacterium]|nr:hypothetical protein [Chlamydiota bacterium]
MRIKILYQHKTQCSAKKPKTHITSHLKKPTAAHEKHILSTFSKEPSKALDKRVRPLTDRTDTEKQRFARNVSKESMLRTVLRARGRDEKYFGSLCHEEPIETSLNLSLVKDLKADYPLHTKRLKIFNGLIEKLIIIFSKPELTIQTAKKAAKEALYLIEIYFDIKLSENDLLHLVDIIKNHRDVLDEDWSNDLEKSHEKFISCLSESEPYLTARERKTVLEINELENDDIAAQKKWNQLLFELENLNFAQIYIKIAMQDRVEQLSNLNAILLRLLESQKSHNDDLLDMANRFLNPSLKFPEEITSIPFYFRRLKTQNDRDWNKDFQTLFQECFNEFNNPRSVLSQKRPQLVEDLKALTILMEQKDLNAERLLNTLRLINFRQLEESYLEKMYLGEVLRSPLPAAASSKVVPPKNAK